MVLMWFLSNKHNASFVGYIGLPSAVTLFFCWGTDNLGDCAAIDVKVCTMVELRPRRFSPLSVAIFFGSQNAGPKRGLGGR